MNTQTDQQLLREYAENRSEQAFDELVRRHIDFVFSAAFRLIRDAHLAEDVAQGVFLALAGNATELARHPILAGWLHRTARNIAGQTVRSNVRRSAREQKALAMNELLSSESEPAWEQIESHLDIALGDLNELDRDVVLLRYFHGQSAQDIGKTLGLTEENARKRLSRALDRLRELFAKRGVTVGSTALAAAISTNAIQAAPVGLSAAITTAAALVGPSAGVAALTTATKAIAMTTLQKTLITATILAAAGAGIYEARQASMLRSQIQSLQQQQQPAGQIAGVTSESDDATRQLAALRDENERLNRNTTELLRLRNEVTQLRRERGAQAQRTNAPAKPPPGARLQAVNSDARYIRKEELANVGYATPLLAIQTMAWAGVNGTYEQLNEVLSPELLADELKDSTNREKFEETRAERQLFKGVQVLAQKNLSADQVELKVKYDDGALPQEEKKAPHINIQPMIKVGNDWKLGGSTRAYTEDWATNGMVVTYTQ